MDHFLTFIISASVAANVLLLLSKFFLSVYKLVEKCMKCKESILLNGDLFDRWQEIETSRDAREGVYYISRVKCDCNGVSLAHII